MFKIIFILIIAVVLFTAFTGNYSVIEGWMYAFIAVMGKIHAMGQAACSWVMEFWHQFSPIH